jgi:AcrR family transcriptional regulator
MAKSKTARPAARAPKQDRSRLSLKRLLDTAADMLEDKGYADFTLQEVSKKAKVSIGSIYHLFANKQELVREVQNRTLDRIEREHAVVINALRRENLPLRKLVPTTVRDYGEFLRTHAGLLRVFMEIAPTDPLIAANGKKYYAQSARDFELLLLDQRDEIHHPDPEHAVRAAFVIMYATIGRYLGLGTSPEVTGEGDWDMLLKDISQMVLYYLLGDPEEIVHS